jgi:hypothetical protein
MGRMDRLDALLLGGIVLVFLATRFAWLYWALPTCVYWEESFRWLSAREILHGPHRPLFDFQADHYQGGSLVMIFTSVLPFHLFGETGAAMKIAAAVYSSVVLGGLYTLGRTVFGRACGVCAALAYVAGPPLVAFWGLVVMGSHGESVLFSLAELFVFFGILSGHWRTPAGWSAFGFVAGVGLWFCYTSGLTLVSCGVAWLLLERRPRASEISSAVAGGLVGMIPWFIYNATHEFAGVTRILEVFGLGDPIDAWESKSIVEKAPQLLLHDLPTSLLRPFENAIDDRSMSVLAAAFFTPLIIALAFSVYRAAATLRSRLAGRQHSPGGTGAAGDFVFVVHGLVFLTALLGSRFTVTADQGIISYRLFLQPAVLMLLPAANSVARGFAAGSRSRSLTALGFSAYLLASSTATFLLATRELPAQEHFQINSGHLVRGVLLHRKHEKDVERAAVAARDSGVASWTYHALRGIGWGLAFRYEKDGDFAPMRSHIESLPLVDRVPVVQGAIWSTGQRIGQVRDVIDSGPGGERERHLLEKLERLDDLLEQELVSVRLRLRAETSNMALAAVTSQSSSAFDMGADRAVDGITDGDHHAAESVSHTEKDHQPWWQVDLGAVVDIDRIEIFNRTDCCSDRLRDYYVFISSTPFEHRTVEETVRDPNVFASFQQEQAQSPTTVAIGRRGRFVRIQLTAEEQFLALAEVRVIPAR